MSKIVFSASKIFKSFDENKDNVLRILQGASLNIKEGEVVGLVGPSGSGKSTFLQIAGLLDSIDKGVITINGVDASRASEALRTQIRRKEIGFVYQFHHLLPDFSALENVVIAQRLSGRSVPEAVENAREILQYVGLGERLEHKPGKLSGGEKQRVAIARAIVNKPSLLLADEPTGNLDPKTSGDVFDMLYKTTKAIGLAMLIVTHNEALSARMDRVVSISKGVMVSKSRAE